MKTKKTLAEARRSRGYTLDALAHSINRQLATVHNWERGRSVPSMADAQRVCEVLEYNTDDIDWTGSHDKNHK